MTASSNGHSRVQIGAFEVDMKAGELRRNGTRIRLQEQPFQILAMLLERPGEVVTREELQGRLWPADTYVDFDHSLNAAVRRLRDAFGDSAENPRFVETVARRGYRLLVPVIVPENGIAASVPQAVPSSEKASESVSGSRARLVAGGLIATLLIGTGLFVGWLLGRKSTLSVPSSIATRRLTANPSQAPILSAAISPDGKYLAYADRTGSYLRQVQTGETHPISLPDNFDALPIGWFPDGSHFIATHTTGPKATTSIWNISILGGTARRLADEGRSPAISPDGSQIAFLRGPSTSDELWMMQSDGSNPRRLLGSRGVMLASPVWAPDARHIAIISGAYHSVYSDITTRIESVDSATGRPELILDRAGMNSGLVWTRDGRLVFSLPENPPNQDDSNLWYLSLDNATARPIGTPTRITRETGVAHSLTATADGKRLAFFRSTWQPDVYVADIEPGKPRLSVPKLLTLDERQDFPYTWSPDSRSVIFSSNRDGDFHIFRQALGQSAAELLVGGGQPVQDGRNVPGRQVLIPRLSSDRTSILYLVSPKLGDTSTRVRLMRLPLAGGPPEFVLEADGINNHQCAFLPSTLCVFSVIKEHQIRFFKFDRGTGKSEEVPQWKIENPNYYKFNWSLSPDGRTLAVSQSDQSAPTEPGMTFKSTVDGSERSFPLPTWANIASFDWASDSQSLWASADKPPNTWWLINIDLNGRATTVLEDRDKKIGWAIPSPDGRHLALWKASGDSNVWMLDNF